MNDYVWETPLCEPVLMKGDSADYYCPRVRPWRIQSQNETAVFEKPEKLILAGRVYNITAVFQGVYNRSVRESNAHIIARPHGSREGAQNKRTSDGGCITAPPWDADLSWPIL